jgi:hypothetical protein
VMRESIEERRRQLFVAGKTVTHSANGRFGVTIVARRS